MRRQGSRRLDVFVARCAARLTARRSVAKRNLSDGAEPCRFQTVLHQERAAPRLRCEACVPDRPQRCGRSSRRLTRSEHREQHHLHCRPCRRRGRGAGLSRAAVIRPGHELRTAALDAPAGAARSVRGAPDGPALIGQVAAMTVAGGKGASPVHRGRCRGPFSATRIPCDSCSAVSAEPAGPPRTHGRCCTGIDSDPSAEPQANEMQRAVIVQLQA